MNKYIYGLLVILTTSLMGSAFAIGKIGLIYSSPILLVAFRFSLAGILMAIFVTLWKRPASTYINRLGQNICDWLFSNRRGDGLYLRKFGNDYSW